MIDTPRVASFSWWQVSLAVVIALVYGILLPVGMLLVVGYLCGLAVFHVVDVGIRFFLI